MRPLSERLAFAESAALRSQKKQQMDERIRQLLDDGLPDSIIKERLGVSLHAIRRVRQGPRRG